LSPLAEINHMLGVGLSDYGLLRWSMLIGRPRPFYTSVTSRQLVSAALRKTVLSSSRFEETLYGLRR
jgi:hypothetical protein